MIINIELENYNWIIQQMANMVKAKKKKKKFRPHVCFQVTFIQDNICKISYSIL